MNKQTIITFLLALFCMAAYGQSDSTKTKKRELSVYATIADHLTHDGIDSQLSLLFQREQELWQSAQPKADICP